MITLVCVMPYLKSSDGCEIVHPFNSFSKTLIGKILFKIFSKTIFAPIFYNKKLKQNCNDTIIVFDDFSSKRFLKWIIKFNKNKRLIFWYWQRIEDTIQPENVPVDFEKWTYCLKDSIKYGMRHNTTLIPNIWNTFEIDQLNEEKFDFVFIGKDKGRKKDLLELESNLKSMGFSVKMFIASSTSRGFVKKGEERRLSYIDYLKYQNEGKCVIDFCVSRDTGLSLRSIEAVLMKKKIMTNCEEIVNYSFFNRKDVFLLDHALDKKELDEFLSSRINYSVQKCIQDYSFDSWLRRFG